MPDQDDNLFSWIHISDIHFGHGATSDRHDQKMVLGRLESDIPKALKLGAPRPQAILVTGDVAFSGNGVVRPPETVSREYDDARAWLVGLAGRLGLTENDVFTVPGNHDVNRGADKDRNTKRLLDALRGGQDGIDTALGEAGDRALLAGRMRGYLAFAKGFAPARIQPDQPDEQRLYWTHTREAPGGLLVRLVGLNTALLSSGDDDAGKLRLGKEQLRNTLPGEPAPRELVIVLSHHPFSPWLADGVDAERWVEGSAHLHLSGHVHEAESRQILRGSGARLVHVVAGAAHSDPGGPPVHGYNLASVVRVEGGKLRLSVWPRRWTKNMDFRVDGESLEDGQTFAEHELRVSLPLVIQHLTVQAPAHRVDRVEEPPVKTGGPLQVFISSAKRDEDDRAEVEKRLKLINMGYRAKSLPPLLEWWSPAMLGAGEDPKPAIAKHLGAADIVLILLSDDALVSEDIFFDEMTAAVERHKTGAARVIPILLRPCDFSAAPFMSYTLTVIPRARLKEGPEAVSKMDRDTAFLEIEQGIKTAAEALRKARA
jgi:predicted MPP superfamily phosphohydrolase